MELYEGEAVKSISWAIYTSFAIDAGMHTTAKMAFFVGLGFFMPKQNNNYWKLKQYAS